MLFSSAAFLFVFLPTTLLLYALVPKGVKNDVLLLASLVFYAFGEPRYTLLLLFSAFFNWLCGLLLIKTEKGKRKKLILAFSVIVNLALLFYYKYMGFFVDIAETLLARPIAFSEQALPIGISFYTFQAISYTVDVYRGDARAEWNLFSFATYLCLFPQLIAGPIVRYTDVAEELSERKHTLAGFADGAFLFAVGLAKKVILADSFAKLTVIYRESTQTVLFAWLYAIAFTLEIYFDFSGYSDMAVGLGKLFGFSFPQNFNYPYIATSITDFWRRWHITLSSWFKSYVYIPLGGNRRGKVRLILNLLAVWLLTGFWHGASFTFLSWGALYAALLIFEKLAGLSLLSRLPAFVGRLYTLFFVILGFVIFNADGMAGAMSDLAALFSVKLPLYDETSLYYLKSYLPLLLVGCVGATPLPKLLFSGKLFQNVEKKPSPLLGYGKAVAMTALLVLSLSFVVGESFRPFLYFRF